ncbi:MAG: HAD family hydrolase [Candidatus Geothermarchaeales archaeon]
MIRNLLIDYDNTLHDSNSKFAAKLEGIFGLSGKELWNLYFFKIHRGIVHKRFPERHDDVELHGELIFEYLGRPYDASTAKLFLESYREARESTWVKPSFFPDTFTFLNRVKEKGYKICLSTGEYVREKAQALERHGSKGYFDYLFEEDDIGYMKTEPDYYRVILRRLNSEPGETVSIGDNLISDIAAPKAVGIQTIWVNRDEEEIPNDVKLKPSRVVRDLIEALNHL